MSENPTAALLRLPNLMEDEGFTQFIIAFSHFEEAEKWLEDNDCVNGYFRIWDFCFVGNVLGKNKYNLKNLRDK